MAGPASGTASESTKKIPVPTVAPMPNAVSSNRPMERLSSLRSVSLWSWGSERSGLGSGEPRHQLLELGRRLHRADLPSDLPAGTISCATLEQGGDAVERGDASYGMDYPTVLHYWMSQGSPDSLDDDRNGLPCETVYPADVVARVSGSPLVVGGGTGGGPVTREQVRAHAEAVRLGGARAGDAVLARRHRLEAVERQPNVRIARARPLRLLEREHAQLALGRVVE